MKKIILVLCICLIYVFISINNEDIVIPDNALRFRIVANDNTSDSQKLKSELNFELNRYLSELLKDTDNYEDANKIINDNLSEIDKKTLHYLFNNKENTSYNISFGKNYFPNKEYKGIKYKSGYYDSLVITLGNGLGNNWWCILFPPLCDLENENIDDVNYKIYAYDLVKKYH